MIAASASHCTVVRCSFRNSMPESAASAGSRLINVPKVRAGIFGNAIISSE
ncbi:hypothetical protein D3C78_1918990 [compost metagenome]